MLARIKKVTDTGDQGASAVEYGLLVAAIAAVIVVIVFLLGGRARPLHDVDAASNNRCHAPAA